MTEQEYISIFAGVNLSVGDAVFRQVLSFQNWKTEFSQFEEEEQAWHGWHHPRSPFGRWMMAHYCQ